MIPGHRSPHPQRWPSLLGALINGTPPDGVGCVHGGAPDGEPGGGGKHAGDIDDLLARSVASVDRQLTMAQAMRSRFAAASVRAASSVGAATLPEESPGEPRGGSAGQPPAGGLDIRW